MRWALIVLLIVNAGYAAWGISRAADQNTPRAPAELPADTPTIHLLSELPLPPAPLPACESFGPFDDEREVERATTEIIAMGLEPIVKEESATDETDGYLVYIDTASRSEASRLQGELQSREIDCAIIPTGRLADSLSVGVFQRRELADAHLRRLAELGYQADLEMLTRSRKLYRVFAPSTACGV